MENLCFDATRSAFSDLTCWGVTAGEATLLICYGEYLNGFSMWCFPFEIIAAHSSLQVENSCCESKTQYEHYESIDIWFCRISGLRIEFVILICYSNEFYLFFNNLI